MSKLSTALVASAFAPTAYAQAPAVPAKAEGEPEPAM